MYSYEDRIRAVELYIKLGKRVRATLGQLGCPTKNALKGWCRDSCCSAIWVFVAKWTSSVRGRRTHVDVDSAL